MRMLDLILKKRDGGALTEGEIRFFVDGVVRGTIPDYQVSAFLMAVYFRGMTEAEVAALTEAMRTSGEVLDLSAVPGVKVDKHSTGGVGDKTTLVALPLAAAVGVKAPKMSGRGLGHTGGTIDKLEAIPGFRTALDREAFLRQVDAVGFAVVGQTEGLVPADKALYALRDVTGTVDSIPLIASSIMSKKLAAGADAIVLDVKVGRGAFMPDEASARALAEAMIAIGRRLGKRTHAILTAMDEPLGREVGNANEVAEAIRVLRGEGPADVEEVAVVVAAEMVLLAGLAPDRAAAVAAVREALADGRGLGAFRAFVAAQGGDPAVVDAPEAVLPRPHHRAAVVAWADGVVTALDARAVGEAAMRAGAGRATKDAAIDLAAGVHLRKKTGEIVRRGEVLADVLASRPVPEDAVLRLREAYALGEKAEDAGLAGRAAGGPASKVLAILDG
ncbi:MAG: thymidine phosphorylase [Hydrogenibacillus schlegelii]|nr:thymidine phosphorylase [Hydrogenibacillus schlegelii]